MENMRIKLHIIPEQLKETWKSNKLVYSIEMYTDGRTWENHILSHSMRIQMDHFEYLEIMKSKFDCIKYGPVLYFKTAKHCKEAIELLESLKLLKKLI